MAQKRDVEGMGIPEIKYGESMCFVQHVSTSLWLTYASVDAKSARLGPLKRKVQILIHITVLLYQINAFLVIIRDLQKINLTDFRHLNSNVNSL